MLYFGSVTVIVFLVLRAIHERARERVVVRVGRGSIRVLRPLVSRLRANACWTPRVLFSAREKCALVSAAGNHISARLRVAPWEGLADECHKKRLLYCAGETFLSFLNPLCFQSVHPHVLQVFPTYSYFEQDSCKIYGFEAIVYSTLFPSIFCLQSNQSNPPFYLPAPYARIDLTRASVAEIGDVHEPGKSGLHVGRAYGGARFSFA